MLISFMFIIVPALMAIAWFFFVRLKLKKREDAWKWASQSMAIFLSVLLGLSVSSLQQNWSRHIQVRAIKEALLEELKIIISQLNDSKGVSMCDPQPDQEDLKVYPVSLPHDVIKIAIDSTVLEANLTRHLVLLHSSIQYYNRWAELGFELLARPDKVSFNRQLLIHNQVIVPTRQNISRKSTFLSDCIQKGTSDLDVDCY